MYVPGQTVTHRFTVKNEDGNLRDAVTIEFSVYPVSFYPQDRDVTVDDAFLIEDEPVRVSRGVYEGTWTVPVDAEEGAWWVMWTGTLSGGERFSYIEKAVVGTETERPDILTYNTLYWLNLVNIESTLGETLSFSSHFTSQYEPYCVSYRTIYNILKGFIANLNEDAVNYLIWKFCLEAEELTLCCKGCSKDQSDYLIFAKKKFVEAAVAVSLLNSMAIGANQNNLKRKRLGDLEVEYNTSQQNIQNFLLKMTKELKDWEQVLNSCGELSSGASYGMRMAVPGIHHIDRPDFGRRIRSGHTGNSHVAADSKVTYEGHIRADHVFTRGRRHRMKGDDRYDF